MLTLPSLPHRCRMTATARGILITKYLVGSIQHTPARNSRGEILHQDFHLLREASWKPSCEDAGSGIKSCTRSLSGRKSLEFSSEKGGHSSIRSSLSGHKVQPRTLEISAGFCYRWKQKSAFSIPLTVQLAWTCRGRVFKPRRACVPFQK